jgi:DNA (cytosine-5)-methyltransferase 1
MFKFAQNRSELMPKKRLYTFIDLFAGCGGLSEGFLQSGHFEGIAHVEWELPMVETLRHRLSSHWDHSEEEAKMAVVHFDIQKTDELINGNWSEDSIKSFGKTNHTELIHKGLKGLVGKKKVDLIIGGPPCQAYSIAGRAQDSNSMKEDYRNYLFESFVKVVEAFQPKVFVFENVPGILSACPGNQPVTERIYEVFKKAGYTILKPSELKLATFTASDFGVPQKRNRVIIVGIKDNSQIKLDEIYSAIKGISENIPLKSVKDVIGHLPPIKPLKNSVRKNGRNISHVYDSDDISDKLHEPRFHNTRDVGIFREWVSKNMNSLKSEEKIKFYNDLIGKKSNHGKYRSLEWHKPSPTVVAHLYKDGLMFIHPDAEQARSITVREAALLQSFPEDYEFLGSQGTCFKMIGNAVPPGMAKGIADGIVTVLDKKQ